MNRLSSPVQNLQAEYEVVVIGSGYGASIAACRMARTGRTVCVLERGRELRPGEYPDTLAEAADELQAQLPQGPIGDRTALFDVRIGHDISVLLGCGLGGTSLINASVCLRADAQVFQQPAWPTEIRKEAALHGLDPYYRRAEIMLGSTPYPQDAPPLRKLQAHEQSARALGRPLHRPPLAVTFRRGMNQAGVPQAGCSLCGDCVSGCNYGAKNTTLMNYLADAHQHGAALFTEIEVRHIERDSTGSGWCIHFDLLGPGRDVFRPPVSFVRAGVVILGAGTLGSSEILLRSQARGLSLSSRLGERFCGNADFVGFAYDCKSPINGIGAGAHSMRGREPVGPSITSYIDLHGQGSPQDDLIVAEGSIPGAMADLLPVAFGLASDIEGQPAPATLWDRMKAALRAVQSNLYGAYTGAVKNTQTYLVTGHDRDHGQLQLKDDRLRVSWPGVGKSPLVQRISQTLEQVAAPLSGTYLKEPLWNRWTREQLITLHPLGGCAMADDASQGVVNHQGQVFSRSQGTDIHDGLYVMDGSTVPTPLRASPLLTICALAERSCDRLAADRGWTINTERRQGSVDSALPDPSMRALDSHTLGVQFSEALNGALTFAATAAQSRDPKAESPDGLDLSLVLTIESDDLDALLNKPQHQATILGSAIAPQLSTQPMLIRAGTFSSHVEAQAPHDVRTHVYRMQLCTKDGRIYHLAGYKALHQVEADAQALLRDGTTLHATLHQGPDETSPVLAQGLLRSSIAGFARQLSTLRILGAHAPERRISAIARAGTFLAGSLFEIYGSVVSEDLPFHAGPPRKKRPLRIGPPEPHAVRTHDGCTLRLLRYHGGAKGPVLLLPGLGTSSQIFATDTIDTNLVEYLGEHGYDVWLLDPRTSIALPTATKPTSADDVATLDYPAAVAEVRRISGADSVQIVAHCFGATALFMSLLSEAGLYGVRSLVISQAGTDIVVPVASELKAGLHMPGVLEDLGLSSVSADPGPGWVNGMLDRIAALQPAALADHDTSPVSRRITLLYGKQYQRRQLSRLTYEHGLRELFGVVSLAALEHQATLVRAGHLVDARGQDVYLRRFDQRLRLPITFIHGAENHCILPESSERTYRRLIERFGTQDYARHVLPGYGHLDCILGQDAVRDVFPRIVAALDAHAHAHDNRPPKA